MVQFNHVTKLYDNRIAAVEDISFTIDPGEFVFLIGPSGSGKTTVIKMLIRDETPSTGQVYFGDKDITRVSRSKVYKLRREIGVIFQDYKLIPDKTAYENVSFAMEAAGKTNKEIKETVPYVLDIVGLSHRMGAFPRQLSGGEQQRVAIARAIANNPKILIADEPTGNLDPASAWDIVQILSKINNWGTTVIMSTHGTDIVNSLNKRVIQMHGGKILRDDNKGQYEMTSQFETQMLEGAEKKHEDKSKKEKKKFQFKLPKEAPSKHTDHDGIKEVLGDGMDINLEEVENIKLEKVKDPGFVNKIFSKFSFKKDEKGLLEYEEDFIEDETPQKKGPEIDVMVGEIDNEKLYKKTAEKKTDKKTVRDLDTKSNVDAPLERPLHHVSVPEETEEAPVEEKAIEMERPTEKKKEKSEVVEKSKKTPVRKLNLPKQILDDLKVAGYKYVEDIIDDGPEGLSKKISIDPEEVIIIAQEIKKFASE